MGRARGMSTFFDKSDPAIVTLASAAISAPWWEQFVETATRIDSVLLMIGGLVLLFLTIYSKIMDIIVKHRQLRNLDKS